jgi:hypothetical protein
MGWFLYVRRPNQKAHDGSGGNVALRLEQGAYHLAASVIPKAALFTEDFLEHLSTF